MNSISSDTSSTKSSVGHFAGIHVLRGLAALTIVFFHLHPVGQVPLPNAWAALTQYGGLGVQLFFVLSAFSLFYTTEKLMLSGNSRWVSDYLLKRFFRIAPLFYIMLLFCYFFIPYKFNADVSFERIMLSLLFIFNFIPGQAEGIVWASWSIGVEMVFYALLPLAILLVRSWRAATVLWLLAVLASYTYRFTLQNTPDIASYATFAFMSHLGIFCGGILGYWVYKFTRTHTEIARQKVTWILLALGPGMAIFLFSDMANFLRGTGRPDIQLWGLAFGFIATLSVVSAKSWMAHPLLQYFGERSYSIYLLHPVVIVIGKPMLSEIYQFCYPFFGGYGFAVCAVAVLIPILLLAELTYRFIEVPGIALGKRFLSHGTKRTQKNFEEHSLDISLAPAYVGTEGGRGP